MGGQVVGKAQESQNHIASALAKWLGETDKRIFAPTGFYGEVFGTGYGAWGVWSQLNLCFTLASTFHWVPEHEELLPLSFRSSEVRVTKLQSLLEYLCASHVSGEQTTLSGDTWGARSQEQDDPREHFENWHSPLWTVTLAQILLRSEDVLSEKLRHRMKQIIVRDAEIQSYLPAQFHVGDAHSNERHGYFTSKGGVNSHPESNSWKASLLTVGRLFGASIDEEREQDLWLSSFLSPAEVAEQERWGDIELWKQPFGTNLTDSGLVVHHGIVHSDYMVFPLLSRIQTFEVCEHFGAPYPDAAARSETKVLGVLEDLILGGRLFYPGGQDWPRWIYGQSYLPVVLLGYFKRGLLRRPNQLGDVLASLEAELSEKDGSLLGFRFEDLYKKQRWHFDRYECDVAFAASSVISLLGELTSFETEGGDKENRIIVEEQAQTLVSRTSKSIVSVSARTLSQRFQVSYMTPQTAEFCEWESNLSASIELLDLPDLSYESTSFEIIRSGLDGSFQVELVSSHGVSPQSKPLIQVSTVVDFNSSDDKLILWQRAIVLRYCRVNSVSFFVQRIPFGRSGNLFVSLEGKKEELLYEPNTDFSGKMLGKRVSLRDTTLSLASDSESSFQLGKAEFNQCALQRSFLCEVSIDVPVGERLLPGTELGSEILVIGQGTHKEASKQEIVEQLNRS